VPEPTTDHLDVTDPVIAAALAHAGESEDDEDDA
jgi:hypothetical protein